MKNIFENWRRFTNESMGDPPEADGWLEEVEMIMQQIVEEDHGTSVTDDVEYAIYQVGEMDPAAEQWLAQNKNRVLALHPNSSMAEGRYSDYDWNMPGNPSPMDVYDMQQRYDRARQRKSAKSSDEPSAEEQRANWSEWQDLHPYEEVSPSQKASIMRNGRAGWPAP